MELRSNIDSLQRAWVAGCIFAGLLLLVGLAGWILQVGFSRGTLVGYGFGSVVVLVFSRGLYHRSIVSGVLLLMTALGPIVRAVVQWMMGAVELGQSVSILMEGAVALSGIGLSVMVIRAIYDLSSEETPQASRYNTRFT
ncbi:hypothetical protein [Salinibacter ruber]|nr:hypothetical protein [Salinibacter ruber]